MSIKSSIDWKRNMDLIYFTLGHNPDYYRLAELNLRSLFDTGYRGDILIIKDNKCTEVLDIDYYGSESPTIDIDKTILYESELPARDIEIYNFHHRHMAKRIKWLEIDCDGMLGASSNKLRLYEYEDIELYDRIIYCDVDALWMSNPESIFVRTDGDLKFIVSTEDHLMCDAWWGGDIWDSDEIEVLDKYKYRGINAGFFAFNREMVPHLKRMYDFMMNNINLKNECLEQPFFNVYLYRNKLYHVGLNDLVSHRGCEIDTYDGHVLHFACGPGDFKLKHEKMLSFIRKNCR